MTEFRDPMPRRYPRLQSALMLLALWLASLGTTIWAWHNLQAGEVNPIRGLAGGLILVFFLPFWLGWLAVKPRPPMTRSPFERAAPLEPDDR